MIDQLTDVQMQVAQLVSLGEPDKIIAAKLSITEDAVGYQIGVIARRLNLDRGKNIRVLIARLMISHYGNV